MCKNYLIAIKAVVMTIFLFCLPGFGIRGADSAIENDDKKAIILAHGQYAPLIYTDGDGKSAGYFYELLQEVFTKRLGIEIEAKALPWTRAQKLAKEGGADLLVTVPTDARKSYMLSSTNPIFESKKRLYTYVNHSLKEQINEARSLDDLAKLNLTTSNKRGNDWFKNNIESRGIKVIYVANEHSYMRMLAAKRIDILILDETSADGVIINLQLEDKIQKVEFIARSAFSHILISKQSQFSVLMPAVNKILAEMEASGELKRLLEKYRNLDFIKTLKLKKSKRDRN